MVARRLERAARSRATSTATQPSKHVARDGRVPAARRRGARWRAGENLRCLKPIAAKPGRRPTEPRRFRRPAPEPLAEGDRRATVTTAERARWRTPRLSGHPRRDCHQCRRPGRCRPCPHRDLRAFRWRHVPAHRRRDLGHGRLGGHDDHAWLVDGSADQATTEPCPARGCEPRTRGCAGHCRTRRLRGGRCSQRPTCRDSWPRCCRHRTAPSCSADPRSASRPL